MNRTLVIGIDCAADINVTGNKTGLVFSSIENATLEVLEIWNRREGKSAFDQVNTWINSVDREDRILLAIDTPMGWPDKFGVSLATHMAGRPLLELSDFPQRTTDIEIRRQLNKTPIDIASNLIARTSFSGLKFIDNLNLELKDKREFRLVASTDFRNGIIEVYPAATLLANRVDIKSYKRNGIENIQRRKDILADLGENKYNINSLKDLSVELVKIEHDFDAFVCCLAAYDFMNNYANCLKPDDKIRAEKEGWIWVKKLGT